MYSTDLADFFVTQVLNLLNDYQKKHQREMVACSPLVAMMYQNAGYELNVNVFELPSVKKEPKLNINFEENKEKLLKLSKLSTNSLDDFPPIKETLVTPRQLFESPDVELVGVMPHYS